MSGLIKWAGSKESFSQVELFLSTIANATPEQLKTAMDWDDEQEECETEHYLMEMQGSLAIITCSGPLISGSSGWWGRWMGICGYDDIRNAVITAVNAGAKEILFHIQTHGGMVAGLGALTEFLQEVNAQVPMTFYTDTYCASAGVWLSTTTGSFKASVFAEVGSIGVMAIMTEYTKYFEENGITKRVFKSTPLKGYGNESEVLSPEAAAEIDRNIQQTADMFIEQVAGGMRLDPAFVRRELATGQMWYADEAKAKGLITQVISFDNLLVDLKNKLSQNSDNYGTPSIGVRNAQSAEGSDMRKQMKGMTEEEIKAAVASGIAIADAAASSEDEDEIDDSEKAKKKDDGSCDDGSDGGEGEGEGDGDGGDGGDAAEASGSIAKLLESTTNKLIAAEGAKLTLQAEVAALKATVDLAKSSEGSLKNIVAIAIQKAFVGAGSAAPALEALKAMSASALVEQYAAAEDALNKRFGKGGRVSIEVDEDSAEEAQAASAFAQYTNDLMQNMARISTNK